MELASANEFSIDRARAHMADMILKPFQKSLVSGPAVIIVADCLSALRLKLSTMIGENRDPLVHLINDSTLISSI